jgi:hypothetical protein
MAVLRIECLRCGTVRSLEPGTGGKRDGGECPRCLYVGWAGSADLSEALRRRLRNLPLERRRLRVA